MEASAAPVPLRFDTHTSQNGGALAPAGDSEARSAEENGRAFDPIELPRTYRVSGVTLAALAAVTGVVAIALGTWAFVASIREEPAEVVRTAPIYGAAQAISLLAKPSTQRIPLEGSEGSAILAVAAGGQSVLVLDGLGLAPEGTAYHAWVVNPKRRPVEHLPAGTFTGVETLVPLTARVPPDWILGVTIERAGGVSAPTRAFRLGARRPA